MGRFYHQKPWHFKSTIFAPIKSLSYDRIMTWSVRKLSSFSPSFTSRIWICNRTNNRGGAIDNPRYSLKNSLYFTATQRISVRSQIWMREMKEGPKLIILRTDHVTIRWKLIYWIRAKAVGTLYLEPRFGSNPAKYPRFYVRAWEQPAKTKAVRDFGWYRYWTEQNCRSKPGPLVGYPDPLLTLHRITQGSIVRIIWLVHFNYPFHYPRLCCNIVGSMVTDCYFGAG